jgi:DNA polymerase III delta prime subunit
MNLSFFEEHPTLDDLDFKTDNLLKFKNIKITDLDMLPNLLFHGPPGSGKTTKIYALLANIFDKKVYDLKNLVHEYDKKVMNYKGSIYHIEINPVDLITNEKLFIQTFLKTYIETRNIGLDIPKIIIIKNANQISNQSQMALRRMIEKNHSSAKFIFEINVLSHFAEPLISRCLLFRVPLPKIEDIRVCLTKNFIKANITDLKIINENIDYIIQESIVIDNHINLKKIFGFFRYFISTKKKFKLLYYEKLNEIFEYICNKRISFINLKKIRDIIHELYINTVPMNEIIIFIFNKIIDKFKDKNIIFKEELMEITVDCDKLLKKGNKECLHAERYVISIIDLLQR